VPNIFRPDPTIYLGGPVPRLTHNAFDLGYVARNHPQRVPTVRHSPPHTPRPGTKPTVAGIDHNGIAPTAETDDLGTAPSAKEETLTPTAETNIRMIHPHPPWCPVTAALVVPMCVTSEPYTCHRTGNIGQKQRSYRKQNTCTCRTGDTGTHTCCHTRNRPLIPRMNHHPNHVQA